MDIDLSITILFYFSGNTVIPNPDSNPPSENIRPTDLCLSKLPQSSQNRSSIGPPSRGSEGHERLSPAGEIFGHRRENSKAGEIFGHRRENSNRENSNQQEDTSSIQVAIVEPRYDFK